MNYYNYNYEFIANQFVNIPTWYSYNNTTIEEIVGFNDYKPSDFHLDGFLDIDDKDSPLYERLNLKELYDYREMIFSLVRKDLRGRYKGSVLGFLWTFINLSIAFCSTSLATVIIDGTFLSIYSCPILALDFSIILSLSM